MSDCVVVSMDKDVRVAEGKGSQQLKQQLKHTWPKYLLAKFSANKYDVIDQANYGDHIKAVKGDDDYGLAGSICPKDALIFTCQRVPKATTKLALSSSNSSRNHSRNQEAVDWLAGGEQCSHSKGLIEEFDQKTDSSTEKCSFGTDHNLNYQSHKSIKTSVWLQPTIHLTLLLTSILILANNNAAPCLGFSGFELYDGPNFANHDPHRQLFNLNQKLPLAIFRQQRQIIADPSNLSLTNDQNVGQAQVSNGWTSMLMDAFQGRQPTEHSLEAHVKRILVPRVSGTQGNVDVREYIIKILEDNNYKIELDEFTDSTPIGPVKFANIIASSNPKACRQLVLACHYDSKMMAGFLGAIDSAVPCAMLLELAETFNKSFRSNDSQDDYEKDPKSSLGLKFIFFDGEEAFVKWSSTDSIYGARHLAERWQKQAAPSQCGANKNELSRIELFVLLDLIGAQDTSLVMYNQDLKHHYQAMQKYEKEYLAKSGMNSLQARREVAFTNRYVPIKFVEDDHVPFMKRGVPILSLLANPFPKVWHTINDNYNAIDFARTRRILHVLEQFVGNYSK